MKRVSYNVAKAIKEAGYPQECDMYYSVPPKDQYIGRKIAQPAYIDVWLWLWQEKGIKLSVEPNENETECYTKDLGKLISQFGNNPEEAIVMAIEYLVDNDLIK